MKRIIPLFLAILLFFTALPVSAVEEEKTLTPLEEQVIQEARQTFLDAQRIAGKKSFHGKCGGLVGAQLKSLGINTQRLAFNGNDSYDYYEQVDMTSGGYYVMTYSGGGFSLLEALQEVSDYGKKNVRNIMVGFHWTNTTAGGKYGHVMLINGIINGNVYFVESFDSAMGGPEGTVLRCTIEEFARSYNKWTEFEGLVHFGTGNYYDVCRSKNTDLTVQARFATTLRSQPAVVGDKKCEVLAEVAPGETFRATAIFGDDRSMYYQVETPEGFGFISCNAMGVRQVNQEGITVSDTKFSESLPCGKAGEFSGSIVDAFGKVDTLECYITDTEGKIVRWESTEISETTAQLPTLGRELMLELLDPGNYKVEIYMIRGCPVVLCGMETEQYTRILLKSYTLKITT